MQFEYLEPKLTSNTCFRVSSICSPIWESPIESGTNDAAQSASNIFVWKVASMLTVASIHLARERPLDALRSAKAPGKPDGFWGNRAFLFVPEEWSLVNPLLFFLNNYVIYMWIELTISLDKLPQIRAEHIWTCHMILISRGRMFIFLANAFFKVSLHSRVSGAGSTAIVQKAWRF